jgi:Icc-related predicted phosphoesterase
MGQVRVVALADSHGFEGGLEVPDGDLLIHAGDLTARGTLPQLEAVRDWLVALPHEHKVVVAGNHDFAFERTAPAARALFASVSYLEDALVEHCGLKVWGSPWQPWFHSWAFNLHRGAPIDAKWRLIPPGVDVLVTHGPPAGFGDRLTDGTRVGCVDLLRHLHRVQPRVHLFGHIHEDPGEWQVGPTRVLNVTVDECLRPCTSFDLEV